MACASGESRARSVTGSEKEVTGPAAAPQRGHALQGQDGARRMQSTWYALQAIGVTGSERGVAGAAAATHC